MRRWSCVITPMTAAPPRDGLPHNTLLSIAQSREGYLWLATWEGLVRYNGNEFRVFDHSRQPALRDSAISAMHAGRDGGRTAPSAYP